MFPVCRHYGSLSPITAANTNSKLKITFLTFFTEQNLLRTRRICVLFEGTAAYNDAFRQLLHEPRWYSASRLFALNNVSSIAALMRKLMFAI